MSVDLHVHTTASDGTLAPRRVVRRAVRQGVRVVSITDHDTTGGLAEALEEAARWSIHIVPGIEINTLYGASEAHILGYWLDVTHAPLQEALARVRSARRDRVAEILCRLEAQGIHLAAEDVARHARGDSAGRPHVALALVDRKVVSSVPEAFERWLGRERPAYVPRVSLDPFEAIALVAAAGGVPVLAHPAYVSGGEEVIVPLIEAGLRGLEAHYPQHTPMQVESFLDLARRYNLAITGGSDFHGPRLKKRSDIGDVNYSLTDLRALCDHVGREMPTLACGSRGAA